MPLAGPKLLFYNTKRGLTAISRATGERADLVSRLVWRCAWRPRFLEFYWEGSVTVPVSVLVSAPASVPALVSAPAPASVSMLPSLSARGYTWPGSSWQPSACGADVIATRPQVLEVCASAEQFLCQSIR